MGRRFARLLVEREACMRDRGFTWRAVGVATRRHGCVFTPTGIDLDSVASPLGPAAVSSTGGDSVAPGFSPAATFIRDAARALGRDREAPLVVVETTVLDIAAGQPAIDHVRAALESGAHVITTNKGPAAFAYAELSDLARQANRRFLFEGAVMDGIPLFNLVRETLPCVRITGFRGVVNSTTNYVIGAMEAGRELDEALAEMQRDGIAEADASLDVDGWDSAAKTAALANVLLDARMTPHAVDRGGIRSLGAERLGDAIRRGRRVKLVARAGREAGGRVAAQVAPVELDAGDPLARLTGMQNAIVLETDLVGEVAITQLTGGLTQTAYALLADLCAVAESGPWPT